MNSVYKKLIFVRDEFILVRMLRFVFWRLNHRSKLADDYKSLVVLFRSSPPQITSISREANYRIVRSQNNLEIYSSIRVNWRDVYGLGVLIETALNNESVSMVKIRYLVNVLYSLLEFRGEWTNNHLIMNLLILKRYFLKINSISEISRLDDLLLKYQTVLWRNEYFLEESSHYLFLTGLRTHLAGASDLSENYLRAYTFYKSVLPFYERMTWIGDVSPDIVSVTVPDEPYAESNMRALDFGFMFCVLSSKYILKISLSDSLSRHGHSDKGHLVFSSWKDEVCDVGIDDLANSMLSQKEVHADWSFGEFDSTCKSHDRLTLKFQNATILCYRLSVEILFNAEISKTSVITNRIQSNDLVMVHKVSGQKSYSRASLLGLVENKNLILCAE